MIVVFILAGAFGALWLIVHCAGENERINLITKDVPRRKK